MVVGACDTEHTLCVQSPTFLFVYVLLKVGMGSRPWLGPVYASPNAPGKRGGRFYKKKGTDGKMQKVYV